MKRKKEFRKILIPRILAAALVVLLYLFVGEILSENFQWSNFLLAIMPGSIYLVITHIAWKHARIGGMFFIILGIGLVLLSILQERYVFGTYILALITFILGFLFIKLYD